MKLKNVIWAGVIFTIGIGILVFLWVRVDHVPITPAEVEKIEQVELILKSLDDVKDLVKKFRG